MGRMDGAAKVRLIAFVAAGLMLLVAPTSLRALTQTTAPNTATIRGRVFDRATGRPLSGALVRVRLTPDNERRALTDAVGRFEIKDLVTGDYQMRVSKDDYINLSYGQNHPSDREQALTVRSGFVYDRTDFGLSRGGMISGRIVDEYGEPVANALVSVRFFRFFRQVQELMWAGSGTVASDALGAYRVVDLEPGEYYVSAAIRPGRQADSLLEGRGHAVTFFPGTASLSEARRVAIRVGSSVEHVNIALIPAALSVISGTVLDASGQTVTEGRVSIGDSWRAMPGASSPIRADGSFALPGVAPGEYIIHGFKNPQNQQADGTAMKTIAVTGRDVGDVRLAFVKPTTASGRIVADAATLEALWRGHASISMLSTVTQGPSYAATPINRGDAFEMKVFPGHHSVRLVNMPSGAFLKAVRYNGVDVTDATLEVKPNENVVGIEVEVSGHPAIVTGILEGKRDVLPRNQTVIVFSRDERRWGAISRYVNSGEIAADGGFTVSGLPPGEYYAIAIDTPAYGRTADPEFLSRLRSSAVSFALEEGQTRVVRLRLARGLTER
jgi:hypothetical protein